jgi:hypothetical protein
MLRRAVELTEQIARLVAAWCIMAVIGLGYWLPEEPLEKRS